MQKKLLKACALFVIVALALSVQVFAQQTRTVTGTVYDENNATLPGATIKVKDTNLGTISDSDGKFTLQVPVTATALEISFVGMESQEVPITGSPVLVTLKTALTSLSEVVVIGYGTVRRSEVTSAISSVKTTELKDLQITGVDQGLQGKLSGVTVTYNSGQPGGGVALRVRGLTSINSNDPLIVIDGVPFQTNTVDSYGYNQMGGGNGQIGNSFLANINPNDIESIDVLKDASAQAIYGSQAANGVIMITTKKGKSADGKVTYDGSIGVGQIPTRLDLMDLPQFAQYQNEILPLVNLEPADEFQDPSLLGPGTDWQEAIFQNALTQNHAISFSGAKEKTSYYLSAAYLNQEGTVIGSDFKRYSGRFNIDHQIKKWLDVGMSANILRSEQNVALTDNAPSGTIWLSAIQSPLIPVKEIDDSWGGGDIIGGIQYYQDNPVAQAETRGNGVVREQIFGNLYANFKFLKDFSFNNEISYSMGQHKNTAYQLAADIGTRIQQSQLYDNRQNSYYWALRNYLTYTKKFSKHFVNATVGHEAQYSYWEQITGKKLDLQNNILDLNVGSTTQSTWELSGGKNNWAMESYFVRANYAFDDRYSLSVSFRADGSSNFHPDNKWGYFPGVSVGWTVTNESFAKSFANVMNYMKLRFGWGGVGNQNLPGGAQNPPYSSGVMFWPGPVGFGTIGSASTNFINGIANPDLGWEEVITTNLGVDLGFFKSRLEASIDIYKKTTSDMLLFTTGPTFLGIGSNWDDLKAPIGNVGQMTNKGIDINVNGYIFMREHFNWNASLIFSSYNNKLDKLLNEASTLAGKVYYDQYTLTLTAPGHPVGSFYGLIYDGIYRTQEDLDNALPQFGFPVDETHTWLGDVRFKDIDGKDENGKRTGEPDGKIDEADMTYIGSPIPKFTFGFTNNFSFYNFDVSLFLQGSYGADVYNFLKWQLEKMDNTYYNQLATVSDRYTETNTDGSLPRFTTTNSNNTYVSTRYVEDGSYLRIQNLTIGYRLPINWIKHVKMTNLRLYFSGQNLYTFTGYSGYDPEIGAFDNTILLMNVDQGHFPNPRVYTFGINVEF